MDLLSLILFFLKITVVFGTKGGLIHKRQITHDAARHWEKEYQEADADTPVAIRIVVRQPNVDAAVAALQHISDPGSSRYGQHWSAGDVTKHFAPSSDDMLAVKNWLRDSGIPSSRIKVLESKGQLLVRSTAGEAGKILGTKFHRYSRQGSTAESRVTSEDYHVPAHLEDIVEFIVASGPDTTAQSKAEQRRSDTPSLSPRDSGPRHDLKEGKKVNCSLYTAPSCLRQLYDMPKDSEPHADSTFGIFHPGGVTWLADDLDLFFSDFEPSLVGRRPKDEKVNGGFMQTDWNVSVMHLETNLNFQYALSLTNPHEVKNIQVGDMAGGTLNNMLAAFDSYYCDKIDPDVDPTYPNSESGWNKTADCGNLKPPKVLAITYGDSEANFPVEYVERQCLEFLKLGLMGTTVVVASGDYGVMSGQFPGSCIDPATGASNSTTNGNFSPSFPSSCPWVTTVGGTQMRAHAQTRPSKSHRRRRRQGGSSNPLKRQRPNTDETAWDQIIGGARGLSGGGFSNVFPAPAYQQRALRSHEKTERSHLRKVNGKYNIQGRGFPDVSLMAYSYLMALQGHISTASGTSASAPVFASMITMINSERLRAGKRTVGFINPVLYENPGVLTDITDGKSVGCGADPAFRATEGWDAVTGLGSVSYEKLLKLFLNLP